MEPAQLISEYGYLAVFIGTVLEGEAILVLAGFAAHQGYLALPLVLLAGCCGGALGDQLFFLAGRRFGPALLRRFPRLAGRVERVDALLRRYRSWLIVGFRFMYGLRVAGPVAMGLGSVSVARFLFFNCIGAVLWALVIGGAGYAFGRTMELFFDGFKRYETRAILLLLGLCLAVALARRCFRRR